MALSDPDLEARLRAALRGADEMVAAPDDLADAVRSRHRRQRRSQLAMAAAGLAAALVFLGAQLISSAVLGSGERTDPAATSPPVVEPEIASLDIDFGTWPQRDDIKAYTVVATGVVYVDADTAEIVWESWTHQRKVIGQLGQDALADPGPGVIFGNRRDIVGNPAHDLVAWVEPAAETPGDLVVVQASTGQELARTDLGGLAAEAAPNPWVDITSVDRESVYFSITFSPLFTVRNGDKVWTWRWSAREPPVSGPEAHLVRDVSGGVWARTVGSNLGFEDASGRLLLELPPAYAYHDGIFFGFGLSPDGRYWHARAYDEVVDLRNGELIPLDLPALLAPRVQEFGWTAATTVTYLADGQWTSCDVTGACRTLEPCGFTYCQSHLPLL